MGVIGWTWLIVAGSFLLYLGVALWSKVTSAADFYVADRAMEEDVTTRTLGLREMVRKHVARQFTSYGILNPSLE